MLPLLDLVFLSFGVVAALQLRRSQRRILSAATAGAMFGVALLVILGIGGWPLLRHRLGYRPIAQSSYSALAAVHFWLGHSTMPLIAFVTPIILTAALVRQSPMWRRLAHVALGTSFGLGFLFLGFTGYLLPREIPNPVTDEVAPLVLRFVILHATVLPSIVFLVCILIMWRNVAKARTSAV